MRAEEMTPDIYWGNGIRTSQRRRPRTRIGRALRRIFTSWQLWTAYCGAITGLALLGSCAPANADDEVFSAPAKQYAAEHARQLCTDLVDATVQEVDELLYLIVTRDHLTPRQAAEAAYFTAITYCPSNIDVLDAYAGQSDPAVYVA